MIDGQEEEEEEDGFWAIAMENNASVDRAWRTRHGGDDDDGDDDVDDDDGGDNNDGETGDTNMVAKAISYRIPGGDAASVTLRLRPLPASDGIWSPVGADAWYASALLACLLLSDPKVDADEFRHPFTTLLSSSSSSSSSSSETNETTVHEKTCQTIVELGSGAVGLSGLVAALALERYLPSSQDETLQSRAWKVLLTDNDPPVLEQLKANLEQNRSVVLPPLGNNEADEGRTTTRRRVDVQVAAWDWKDDRPSCGGHLLRAGTTDEDEVVLVLGSELVYTQETADACVDLLLRLLQAYPRVEIWIVQVSDRFGWWETVVPTLLSSSSSQEHHANMDIAVDTIPIPTEIHDMASTMIPMGGTLDRHAYGAFCIYRTKPKESTTGTY